MRFVTVQDTSEDSILSPEQIAIEVMRSEAMLWLMVGGDPQHHEAHLDSLRSTWNAYIVAGGKTWGR